MDSPGAGTRWSGLSVATLWVALWLAALVVVTRPWRELGGLVSERTRWLGRFVALTGLCLGFTAARWAVSDEPPTRGPWPRKLRRLLYPPGAAAAIAMTILRLRGDAEAVGIALTSLVAVVAGIWTGLWQVTGEALARLVRIPRTRRRTRGRRSASSRV